MFVIVSEMFEYTEQGQVHVLSTSGLHALAGNVPHVGVLPALNHLAGVAHIIARVLILLEQVSTHSHGLGLVGLKTSLPSLETLRSVPVSNSGLALLALESHLRLDGSLRVAGLSAVSLYGGPLSYLSPEC